MPTLKDLEDELEKKIRDQHQIDAWKYAFLGLKKILRGASRGTVSNVQPKDPMK